jgi:hypothetical protein
LWFLPSEKNHMGLGWDWDAILVRKESTLDAG